MINGEIVWEWVEKTDPNCKVKAVKLNGENDYWLIRFRLWSCIVIRPSKCAVSQSLCSKWLPMLVSGRGYSKEAVIKPIFCHYWDLCRSAVIQKQHPFDCGDGSEKVLRLMFCCRFSCKLRAVGVIRGVWILLGASTKSLGSGREERWPVQAECCWGLSPQQANISCTVYIIKTVCL